MQSKDEYLIIADKMDPSKTFGENIRATIATAGNFKKAYDLALSMGEIAVPKLGYKSSLRKVTSELAIQLEDKVSSNIVTIALIKKY